MRILHDRRSGSARSVGRSRALKCYTVTDAAGDVEVVARDPVHALRFSGKQKGRITNIQPWNYASIDAIRSYLHGGARLPQGAELAGGEVVVPPLEGFVTVWRTTAVNETITIPLTTGTYNAVVNWGDGTPDSIITSSADADRIHAYAVAGDYTVTITGTFPRIYFNNAGDKLKIRKVLNWGAVGWTSMNGAFRGCTNLNEVSAGDNGNLPAGDMAFCFEATSIPSLDLTGHPGVTGSLSSMCASCASLTTAIVPGLCTINSTGLSATFSGCGALATIVGLETWVTNNIITMLNLFQNCALLTTLPIAGWNTAKVASFAGTLRNIPLVPTINLSGWSSAAATDLSRMFYASTLQNPSVAHFDVGLVTTCTQMFFEPCGLSNANYDALLIAWAAQSPDLKPAVPFDGGGAKYSAGAATSARGVLTGTHSWAITDGGPAALLVFEDMQNEPENLLTRIPTVDVQNSGWEVLAGMGEVGDNSLLAGAEGLLAQIDAGAADVVITCTVQAFAEVGVILRGGPPGDTYMQVMLRPDDGYLYLERVEPAVVWVHSMPAIEIGDHEEHHIQVHMLGQNIKIYFDGVLLIEAEEVFHFMNPWHGVKCAAGATYVREFAIAAHP